MASTTEDVIIRYRAEVDQAEKELQSLADEQQKLIDNEKEQQTATKKTVTVEEQAAKKRKDLIKAEQAEIAKMRQLRAQAFDPKVIDNYNRKITESKNKIALLKGETQSLGSTLSGAFAGVGAALTGALSAAAIINFGSQSINAFLEAEENANRLKFAIEEIGDAGEEAFDRLIRQSSDLQKITIFSDDAIQQAQTALATFGLTADQIEALTPRLADFASATGKSIQDAANSVGQGIQGMGREFKRFGIQVSAEQTPIENYNALLEGMVKFSGAAENATTTLTGALKQQENQVDDLQEKVGEGLAPAWVAVKKAAFEATLSLIDFFNFSGGIVSTRNLKTENEKLAETIGETNKKIVEQKKVLVDAGKAETEATQIVIDNIRNQALEQTKLNVARLKALLESKDASEAEIALAKLRLTASRRELAAITDIAAAQARLREESRKALTDDQLRILSTERLNELLILNQKLIGITADSNVQKIQEELKAREKLAEEIKKQQKEKPVIDTEFRATPIPPTAVQIKIEPAQVQKAVNDANLPETLEPIVLPVKIEPGSFLDAFLLANGEILQASSDVFSELAALSSTFANRRIDDINRERDAQIEAIDEQLKIVDESLEKRRISEKDAEATRNRLLDQRLKAEQDAAKKEREIKRRALIVEKAAALVRIAISTAENIASAKNPVLIALYAALGAAQAAVVASQPIPYKKGSKDTGAKGHMARVGEEGEEIVYMPSHSKVLPSRQTKEYSQLLDAMFDNRVDRFIETRYVTPRLIEARQQQEQQRSESFAQNVARSIQPTYMKTTGSDKSDVTAWISPEVADAIGRAVARNLPSDPYLR